MGYVKTRAEVEELERYFSEPLFTMEGLWLDFQTTPEFVASVLPPCLQPAASPSGEILVANCQSRCCGEFGGAAIFLRARYGDIEGLYTIEMLISNDMPVTWGREVLGEVKKTANIVLYRDGDDRFGYVERNGVRLVELEASLGPDEGPAEQVGHALEIKAYPSADGRGLQYDPLLVVVEIADRFEHTASGDGSPTLRGTAFDPVHTVPVMGISRVGYFTGESRYRTVAMIPQPNRDDYVPYVYGRHYDDLRLFDQPLRYRRAEASVTAGEADTPAERVFVTG